MSEEDIRNYKKYISELDITKYIVLDKDKNYWYSAEYVDKMLEKQDKEIERLNNIINKIDQLFEADTHCEDIYYAIGVILNKKYYDIEMISNEEILNILGSDK